MQEAAVRADVRLGVEKLYLGLLIARRQQAAAAALVEARRRGASDAAGAARAGTLISTAAAEARAGEAEALYGAMSAANRAADLQDALGELLGLPAGTELELAPPAPTAPLAPLATYLAAAGEASPEVLAADARVAQARQGVALARSEWIPDVGVAVSHTYQDALAFLPRNSTSLTIQGSWTVWDWGKRTATLRERRAGAELAGLAARRVRDSVGVAIASAYRAAERAESAAALARTALDARQDAWRVVSLNATRGAATATQSSDAAAALAAAQARMLEADLGVRVARAELARLTGAEPPSGGGRVASH